MYYMNSIVYTFFGDSAKVDWATNVDRNTLPPPSRELSWYEYDEKRNVVDAIFFGLGTLSAGAAVFTAVYLTATLTTVLIAASLALIATASIVAAIYLYTMEPSPLDPIYRMEKRNELLSETEAPPFSELDSALEGDILTRDEIQVIMEHEIKGMDFDSFIQKHQMQGLYFLDSENRSLLKPKYVESLLRKKLGEVELGDALMSEEAKIFNLAVEDLSQEPSMIQAIVSYVKNNAANLVVKAAESVLPTEIKNATRCASASITYAMRGEYAKSGYAALGAVTSTGVYIADKTMKTEYPEAYEMADQALDYEKNLK